VLVEVFECAILPLYDHQQDVPHDQGSIWDSLKIKNYVVIFFLKKMLKLNRDKNSRKTQWPMGVLHFLARRIHPVDNGFRCVDLQGR